MYRVLLTDHMTREAIDVFKDYPQIEIVSAGTLGDDELSRAIADVDAVIVRSPTRLTRDIIAAGRRLKFIGRAGVGVDNIDVGEATSRGIAVLNVPSGNTISTAEHTVGMILALAKRIPEADRSLRAGRWDRKDLDGVELHGKTLGIIGFGRVGREVARRMLGFSMKVIAADPYVPGKEADEMGVRLVERPGLLRESHVISIHVVLTNETRKLISHGEIAQMRDGVLLVNCSRGEVIDEAAVREGLDSGKLRGVALDVFEQEPPGRNPLFSHPRSVFTPHVGAATPEARVRVAVCIAQNIAKALTTGEIRDSVRGTPD